MRAGSLGRSCKVLQPWCLLTVVATIDPFFLFLQCNFNLLHALWYFCIYTESETNSSENGTGSVNSEYRRLFQPYSSYSRLGRRGPVLSSGSSSAPKRSRLAIPPPKMWRHNFVFLRHPHSSLPDARERANLMVLGLGERKLEFQEGTNGTPAHVHEVLIKEHPDLSSTGYELCCSSSNRFLDIISPPPRGFTVDFLKTYLHHSKCYVRPVQGSLEATVNESSVSSIFKYIIL